MNAVAREVDPASQLVADVLVAVTSLPDACFWRANTGRAVTARGAVVQFNLPGTPDILGCYRGRGVGIECKWGTGRLSADQKRWRANWERGGGLYIVARSVDATLADLGAS